MYFPWKIETNELEDISVCAKFAHAAADGKTYDIVAHQGGLESGELDADSTVAFFATAQKEGARQIERQIAYYNLDMIIGVGYAKII